MRRPLTFLYWVLLICLSIEVIYIFFRYVLPDVIRQMQLL